MIQYICIYMSSVGVWALGYFVLRTVDIKSPIKHPRIRDRAPQSRRRTIQTPQRRTVVFTAPVREPQETRRPHLPGFARLGREAPCEHPVVHPQAVPTARVRRAGTAA